MENKQRLMDLICRVLKDVDPHFFSHQKIVDITETNLMGNLESLPMVNLVVSLEESIKNEFGKDVTLLGGDGSLPPTQSFKTILNLS